MLDVYASDCVYKIFVHKSVCGRMSIVILNILPCTSVCIGSLHLHSQTRTRHAPNACMPHSTSRANEVHMLDMWCAHSYHVYERSLRPSHVITIVIMLYSCPLSPSRLLAHLFSMSKSWNRVKNWNLIRISSNFESHFNYFGTRNREKEEL